MGLRTRLLLAFSSIALLVLLLFGILSYRVAADAALKTQAEVFHKITDHTLSLMREFIGDGVVDVSKLAKVYRRLPYQNQLLLVRDVNGEVTRLSFEGQWAGPMVDHIEVYAKSIAKEDDQHGVIDLGKRRYYWSSREFNGNAHTLVFIYPFEDSEHYGTLIGRILIIGGVIFWIAVWAALILASWIAKKLEEKNKILMYQSLHDNLTGLPNRSLFSNNLEQALTSSARFKKTITLYVMDLDRFKEINDTLGHQCGDKLLMHIAQSLECNSRKCHTIARLGGDEFAVLYFHDSAEDIPIMAHELMVKLSKPCVIEGIELKMKASIGIAYFPEHGQCAEDLVRHAEVAMYQAKEIKAEYLIYQAQEDPFNVRRLTLVGELQNAIECDQLALHYQPKIDMRENKILGVECLVRWQHPKLGFIPPIEFVPIAEQTGLIGPLSLWVINHALQQCSEWHRRGLKLGIAVNISTQNLQSEHFTDRVSSLLAKWEVLPKYLEFEITEGVMMDDVTSTLQCMEKLRRTGIGFSVDDFGTGFSSMNYLRQLPINELKIDRSFVFEMENNESDRMIVQSIIDLSHNLGYQVVAEGIESESVLLNLHAMGCDIAQGYYISKPLTAVDFEKWLKMSKWTYSGIAVA